MTLNELVLTFGGLHLCVKFGENRQRNATVRVTTHGQTHRQTDANRFYYLSHAICYSYGADNKLYFVLSLIRRCFVCSHVDSVDQSLILLVTGKREKDVLGQIVIPLSNIEDSCVTEPLQVPLQPGFHCPDRFTSPGELAYCVWITTEDITRPAEDRSLTSRTTAGLSKLRRRLNSPPIVSGASRWDDFKISRRHSMDAILDLRLGDSSDFCHIALDDDSSPTTPEECFTPFPTSDGYIKRSSLPIVSEYYFPLPQILEVCPSVGPTSGGTVVTVRGRDLGLSQDDVAGLYICGSDVVDTVQYISSERLVCTTVAWRPCVGCVTVETVSGGRSCSAAQFTFMAVSEPPASRVYRSSAESVYEVSKTIDQRHRFSLSDLDNIESSCLWDNESQITTRKELLRRQKSHEVRTSAAMLNSELGLSTVEVQRTKTSRSPTKLPQIEDHLSWKSVDEKVNQILFYFLNFSLPVKNRMHKLFYIQVAQKLAPFLHALALPNINRFSKLFHYQNQQKICNNTVTKDPTTP